jgi:hypothetical protein
MSRAGIMPALFLAAHAEERTRNCAISLRIPVIASRRALSAAAQNATKAAEINEPDESVI